MAENTLNTPVAPQATRIDATLLPKTFPQPYLLYIIQQGIDLGNVADKANEAGQGAWDAHQKIDEHDQVLSAHTAEIATLKAEAVTTSASTNQSVQGRGGSFLVGDIPSPTGGTLQVGGSVNARGGYCVAGTQVVSSRQYGWTPAVGTALKGAFNADADFSVGTTYSRVEVQALARGLVEARRRIKALEDALRTHGLINR